MNVRKFTAVTTRDALRMVRDELGDEAVILSNRKVEGGIEIMAMSNDGSGRQKKTDSFASQSPVPEAQQTTSSRALFQPLVLSLKNQSPRYPRPISSRCPLPPSLPNSKCWSRK